MCLCLCIFVMHFRLQRVLSRYHTPMTTVILFGFFFGWSSSLIGYSFAGSYDPIDPASAPKAAASAIFYSSTHVA